MNQIELVMTSLRTDERARYEDVCIDGDFFQKTLREKFSSDFDKGRYLEEFVPMFYSKSNIFSFPSFVKDLKVIVPIYKCQDDCCMYLFAEIEYTESRVNWNRIAQNSDYFGDGGNEMGPLVWLKDFERLVFDRGQYDKVYH